MSPFFDELEQRLRASVAEQHGRAAQRAAAPQAPAAPRRGNRRGLFALVAALVVAGAAVPGVPAVTGLWQPDVERQAPWPTSTTPATEVLSCDARSPRFRAGPPIGPEFAAVFAVFGRPATKADRMRRAYLRPLPLVGVDVDGIRRVGTEDGRPFFLIPAQGMGRQPPPERCLRGLSQAQRAAVAAPPRMVPTVCWGGGGGGCSTLADLARHGSYGSGGVVRGRATITGLAPNGVRAVRVTYGRSTRTFEVRDNFFSFRLGIDVEQASSPDRLEWLMEDGSVRDVTR